MVQILGLHFCIVNAIELASLRGEARANGLTMNCYIFVILPSIKAILLKRLNSPRRMSC